MFVGMGWGMLGGRHKTEVSPVSKIHSFLVGKAY